MEIFLVVVPIVAAVLQIILFFKIWGMTDNVKTMKEKYCSNEIKEIALAREVLKLHLLGKDNEAELIITENLITKVIKICEVTGDSVEYKNDMIKNLKQRAEKLYGLIDKPVPTTIADINVGKLSEVLCNF